MKLEITRCPSCGAPIQGTRCDYCKTEVRRVYDKADTEAIMGSLTAMIPSYPTATRPQENSSYGMCFTSCTVPTNMAMTSCIASYPMRHKDIMVLE